MEKQKRAVFLDRDGTIIKDVHYLSNPKEIEFLPGAIDGIKRLNEAGFLVMVISNQSGVARGLLSEDMLQTIDKTMHKLLLAQGAHLDASYYCPHHPDHGVYPYNDECECRKPSPGMLIRAAKENQVNLDRSFMIGDKASDIEAGQGAGTKTILVLTGVGTESRSKLKQPANHIAKDLTEAAAWIVDQ
ncbi:MAG: D-glycero-beta-D-manno-heptose 1,7-bisphosphate 7-phosphatase [Candidatus Margulisbacteria bacterium]|nr:D-glycero-beta-D-manno-heptose 1,7-bisphosphate 7-phosphatase [Candidatus Margulisiibacteriota bacterium]